MRREHDISNESRSSISLLYMHMAGLSDSFLKRRWQLACDQRAIAVRKTRPHRPQTNGKAERFIRTMLERWAYAYPYTNEPERAAALPAALDSYNRYRPHRALDGQTPLQRVNNLSVTNT